MATSPQNTLGWGVIGCGDVVFKKSGPSIMAADRSRIEAVMRREPAKAQAFADANGAALCTADADAVIACPDVDIVYVATPPASHKEYVLAAAAAGKHVLVEKPMGMAVAEDREMIDACQAAGVELFVAYYRRFHPHVLKMIELINAGRIGAPVMAQIDFASPTIGGYDWGWRLQKDISGGGLFVDVVSHRIDLMVRILGKPAEVRGLTATFDPTYGVEDAATLAVRFDSGALCGISGDFASGRHADRFAIYGTKGAIVSDPLDGHGFEVHNGENIEPFRFEKDAGPHLGLIRHIERVLEGQEPNGASGVDGMATDRILDEGLDRRTS